MHPDPLACNQRLGFAEFRLQLLLHHIGVAVMGQKPLFQSSLKAIKRAGAPRAAIGLPATLLTAEFAHRLGGATQLLGNAAPAPASSTEGKDLPNGLWGLQSRGPGALLQSWHRLSNRAGGGIGGTLWLSEEGQFSCRSCSVFDVA